MRDAAELAGCSHHTVARYVEAREQERLVPGTLARRPGVFEGFLPKLEELAEQSHGKIRADVAHEKITAMGYAGSGRTTRRAVAQIKLLEKSVPSVSTAVDTALRRAGGVPTHLQTDNKKTVTVEHVGGLPVRNPAAVAPGRHYGLTIATCVPCTVRSRSWRRPAPGFCEQVNARPHRATRRASADAQ